MIEAIIERREVGTAVRQGPLFAAVAAGERGAPKRPYARRLAPDYDSYREQISGKAMDVSEFDNGIGEFPFTVQAQR